VEEGGRISTEKGFETPQRGGRKLWREEWMRDRARLRDVLLRYPHWRVQDYAQTVGRSRSGVKKWRKRLREADPHDAQVLVSRSRAHHAPYPSWDPRVEERIVEMRSSPPENLKRVPGPRALLYYLPRDEELQALQLPLPCSSRTVWKILHKHGCILERPMRKQTASGAKSTPRRDSDGRAKTSVRCPAVKVRRASGNTLWRSATLWMQALRSDVSELRTEKATKWLDDFSLSLSLS